MDRSRRSCLYDVDHAYFREASRGGKAISAGGAGASSSAFQSHVVFGHGDSLSHACCSFVKQLGAASGYDSKVMVFQNDTSTLAAFLLFTPFRAASLASDSGNSVQDFRRIFSFAFMTGGNYKT